MAAALVRAPSVPRSALGVRFAPAWASRPELLVGGDRFFPRIQEDLAGASSSIHVNQFGFRPGRVGDTMAALLVERARAGVDVRVVVDENGSAPHASSRKLFAGLARAGVEVVVTRAFRPLGRRGPLGMHGPVVFDAGALGHVDHRKVVIVDGRVAWCGGAGFEDHFADGRFHDLFVRLEGSVVAQLQLVLLTSFLQLGGPRPVELAPLFPDAGPRPDGAADAVVLHNAPGGVRPVTEAIAQLIDGAGRTLDVVNPYVTDPATIRRLCAAARRGVAVRLVVPAKANNVPCRLAQRHHHAALLDAGVAIFEHPAMVHAKALVADGRDVLAGTCNLDAWSLRRFFEIDVRLDSPALAARFREDLFDPDAARSRPARPVEGRGARAASAVAAALAPVL